MNNFYVILNILSSFFCHMNAFKTHTFLCGHEEFFFPIIYTLGVSYTNMCAPYTFIYIFMHIYVHIYQLFPQLISYYLHFFIINKTYEFYTYIFIWTCFSTSQLNKKEWNYTDLNLTLWGSGKLLFKVTALCYILTVRYDNSGCFTFHHHSV